MFYPERELWPEFEPVLWHLVPVGGTDCQRFLRENMMRLSTLGLSAGSSAADLFSFLLV